MDTPGYGSPGRLPQGRGVRERATGSVRIHNHRDGKAAWCSVPAQGMYSAE
ncbi:MAG TPA: hypothetical protein QF423_00600 [Candidatus Scalindua sp.]|nr:hypothetical protein [Candidatus Scalindua sp.]